MHKKHFVHRDLKCENIVFDRPGKDGILKIIDFGMSEYINNPQDEDNNMCGTVWYMAPGIFALYLWYIFFCH